MFYFVDSVIKPLIVRRDHARVCEIGASYGRTSDELLKLPGVTLTIVDPCADENLEAKYSLDARVTVRRGLSLETLPRLRDPFDCILIDGDHNWYTVFHELEAIETHGLLGPGGTIFFHDVAWPYARRDMYYQPELIPADQRQPYCKSGIVWGQSELDDEGINAQRFNALAEGGPRNGVLTAIEDFVAQARGRYLVAHTTLETGLGVVMRYDGPRDYRSWLGLCAKLKYLDWKTRLAWRIQGWRKKFVSVPG